MKYVSLIGVMRLYGHKIKEWHHLCEMDSEMSTKIYSDTTDYVPFEIKRSTDAKEGQVLYTVQYNSCRRNGHYAYSRYIPITAFDMPPILEIEWLRTQSGLERDIMDILQQLGYMFLTHVMSWHCDTRVTQTSWMESLDVNGIIIDVEDLSDTAAILLREEVLRINMPSVNTYYNVLMYGTDVPGILNLCMQQTDSMKEYYHHLPIMLSMFMVDCYGNEFQDWTKSERIDTESKLRAIMNTCTALSVHPGKRCTYGTSNGITERDVDIIRSVFGVMLEKLHEKNRKLGTISYWNYERIKGPDTVDADVMLGSMDINWESEMERARQEKETAEKVDGNGR